MFTKYNGVEIPKNYSGNRFKSPAETEMKTHRATSTTIQQTSVKSSVSPSFQEIIDKTANQSDSPTQEELTSVSDEEILDDIADTPPEKINEKTALITEDAKKNDFNLMSLLDKIGKDDLLLIALIIILASESTESSTDIILCLALLLLFH